MRGGVRAPAARLLRRGGAARRRTGARSPLASDTLIGFACYEATCRNFFGPELVHPEQRRGRGIGKALLLAALHAMRAEGYAYGIIGWASSIDFYRGRSARR